jgi:hypothetical protein
MSSPRRYAYNPPRWALIYSVIFLGAFSALMGYASHRNNGAVINGIWAILCVLLAIMSLGILTRLLVFSRTLELTDDAILVPRGFTKFTKIFYTEIERMWEDRWPDRAVLQLVTAKQKHGINAWFFKNEETYLQVRDFIYLHAPTVRARHDLHNPPVEMIWRELPEPIVQWEQPDIYPSYRTHLIVATQPLWRRLGKVLTCFCYWFLPCFALIYFFDLPTESLVICTLAALWFAFITWISIHHPAGWRRVSLHAEFVHEFYGKQSWQFEYSTVTGWAACERRFANDTLHFLMLIFKNGRRHEWCMPDTNTCDRAIQLLREKKIPLIPELKPSWE